MREEALREALSKQTDPSPSAVLDLDLDPFTKNRASFTGLRCRILGTFYGHPREVPKSATVFNLGYADQAAERWPHVARLTEDWGQPRRPRRAGGAPA